MKAFLSSPIDLVKVVQSNRFLLVDSLVNHGFQICPSVFQKVDRQEGLGFMGASS